MANHFVLVSVAIALLVLTDGSAGRPVTPGPQHQLLQEKEINQQLALIEKLVGVMLNVTKCNETEKTGSVEEKEKTGIVEEKEKTGIVEETEKTGIVEETEKTGIVEETEKTGIVEEVTQQENTTVTQAPEPSECDYSSISPRHTAIMEKSDCEIHKTGLTPEEQELVLKLHNDHRAKVARGAETRGSPGPQPPAANMRQLVWNEELALVSQAWAEQCPRGHDQSRDRLICSKDYQVGQNIHYYWGFNEDPDWERAVNEWYDEVADMPNTFTASFQLLKKKKIGHYTQVVWSDTSEIGCGVVHYETEVRGKLYPESKTYVCNYGKAGNVRERPMYINGSAASQCPNGVSSTYPDLCV